MNCTTQINGWEKRMTKKINELFDTASNLIICPKCGSVMVERSGKYGDFLGCSSFPNCRHTQKIVKKQPVQQQPQVSQPEPKDNKDDFDFFDSVFEDNEKETVKKDKTITYSKYQNDIFDFVKDNDGNAIINAVAGSGKTTTGIKALELTPKNAVVTFLAFNKLIAGELSKRAPGHVSASTIHSLCYANIRDGLGDSVKVDKNKLYWIIRNLQKGLHGNLADSLAMNENAMVNVINLLKANMILPTVTNINYIKQFYCIDLPEFSGMYEYIKKAFIISVENKKVIDFTDMIYFCANNFVKNKKFDFMFIDEAQDLNTAQIQFVLNSMWEGENTRVISIGDPNQSLYGFRGANTNAMSNLKNALNAKSLPLSICYRCPESHVGLAKKLVPEIEAAPNAIPGNIYDIKPSMLTDYAKDGDLVLCRTNAPLVSHAFSLISQGIKAVILGRDIGTGLAKLIDKVVKKSKTKSLSGMLCELDEYFYSEYSKMIAAGRESSAQSLNDRVETINALSIGCKTTNEVKAKINSVFTDRSQGVTFSSVHRAKGLESNNVFLLKPSLIPHPMALKTQNHDIIQQEYNIKYVALTRAKKNLYFVE